MPTIHAYLRVSTNHQKQSGNGISAQYDSVVAHCNRNDLNLGDVVFYRDEGISGTLPVEQRPGLSALLHALKSQDIVIVPSLCRLSRDLMMTLMIEAEIKKIQARLVSTKDEGTRDDDPTSVLLRRVIQSFSEFERNVISARTKAALQARKNRGLRTGHIPFGFNVDSDKKLIPEESEIRTILRTIELRDEGLTYNKVAEQLNSEGLFNRNGKWYQSSLYRVLKGWNKDGQNRYSTFQQQRVA